MLEQKLAEAKSKKDTLKARAKSAAASKQITEMIQGLDTSSAMAAFDKMEEKVMALEAESEATLQVRGPRR
jgi:phage shock protein A